MPKTVIHPENTSLIKLLEDVVESCGDLTKELKAELATKLNQTANRSLEENDQKTIAEAIFYLGHGNIGDREDLAQKLISKIDPENFSKETQFDLLDAVANNRLSVKKILIPLIKAGFEVDAANEKGETALSRFASQIRADISSPEEGSVDYQIFTALGGGISEEERKGELEGEEDDIVLLGGNIGAPSGKLLRSPQQCCTIS